MSIEKGFTEAALKAGRDYGANAMQLFTKSPRSRFVKEISPQDADGFKDACRKFGIKFVVAHSSYLLNIAKPLDQAPWMLKDLSSDFERLHLLGGQGIIVHAGKSLEAGFINAVHNLVANTIKVLEETAHTPLLFIFENTAGQGTEIGSKLEELATIWNELKIAINHAGSGLQSQLPRLKFCLDTAHLWGAGYDLSTRQNVQIFFKEFDNLIGLKNLACIHFNDSKKECGSRVDRHDNLLQGKIGKAGLQAIVEFAEKNSVPLIIETPQKDGNTHLEDLNLVRSTLQK